MAKKQNETISKEIDQSRPFLGLRSFEEKNKSQFGGRDDEINELFGLVEDNNLTVVFGTSGIGKTSLLKAGLMPKLRKKFYFPIYVRIDYSSKKSPLVQLRELVYQTMKELDSNISEIGSKVLWEYLHDTNLLNGLVTPVVIFDQFEEIFTLGKSNKHTKEFVTELADLAQNRVPAIIKEKYKKQHKTVPSRYSKQSYRIVLSLREDYLARLDELKGYIPGILDNGIRVVQMTIAQAMEAAIKPGKGLIGEPVARKIINILPGVSQADFDVLEKQDDANKKLKVEPFLLSLICDRLNEKRIEKGLSTITSELVEQFKVDDVIVSFYDDSIKKYVDNVDHAIQNKLIDAEGYRKLHALKEFQSAYNISDDVVDALVIARIIRKENRNNVDYLELIHDVLAPVIKNKRDERLKEEQDALRRAEQAKQEAEREAAIIKDKEEIKKRNKRRIALILPVVIGIAVYALFNQSRIYKEHDRVEKMAESRSYLNSAKNEILFSTSKIQAAIYSDTAYALFKEYMKPEAGDYIFEGLYFNSMITTYNALIIDKNKDKNSFKINTTSQAENNINIAKDSIGLHPGLNPQDVKTKTLAEIKNKADVSPTRVGEPYTTKFLSGNINSRKSQNYNAMAPGKSTETYYIGSKRGEILKISKDSATYKIESIYKSKDIKRVLSMAFKNNLLAIANTKDFIHIYDVGKNKLAKKINLKTILDTDNTQDIISFGLTSNNEVILLKNDRKNDQQSIIKWDIKSEKLLNWSLIDSHHFLKWNDSLNVYDYKKIKPSDFEYLKLGGPEFTLPKKEFHEHNKESESTKKLFFLSFSSNSKLAIGIRNGLVIIDGNECYEIENKRFLNISFAKFNPSGDYLIVGNTKGQLFTINFNKEAKRKDAIEIKELTLLQTSKIADIAFPPNDRSFDTAQFATADAKGLVVKWMKDNNNWSAIPMDYKVLGHKKDLEGVIGMTFSKDGEFLTVFHGDNDNSIIRWPSSMNSINNLMDKKLKEIEKKKKEKNKGIKNISDKYKKTLN